MLVETSRAGAPFPHCGAADGVGRGPPRRPRGHMSLNAHLVSERLTVLFILLSTLGKNFPFSWGRRQAAQRSLITAPRRKLSFPTQPSPQDKSRIGRKLFHAGGESLQSCTLEAYLRCRRLALALLHPAIRLLADADASCRTSPKRHRPWGGLGGRGRRPHSKAPIPGRTPNPAAAVFEFAKPSLRALPSP